MNLQPFFEAPFAIQVHMIAAFAALFLGAIVLWRRKGGIVHKVSGRVWVGLMLVVSLTGLFIHEIRVWGNYSPIHIFSIVVPVSLFYAIWRVRRGEIEEHRRSMQSTFVGAMVFAGGFTLLPGRMTNDILFGESNLDIFESAGGWLLPLVVAGTIFAYFSYRAARKS